MKLNTIARPSSSYERSEVNGQACFHLYEKECDQLQVGAIIELMCMHDVYKQDNDSLGEKYTLSSQVIMAVDSLIA